jgi:hypothetical protein
VPAIAGTLHLVDGEVMEQSHLERHVLASLDDVGKAKVDVASRALATPGLDVRAHAKPWAKYLEDRGDWHLSRVAVALGSARDRVAIQAALPRVVMNAWTQAEDIGVSRHPDFLRTPCLACLYGPKSAGPAESEAIAAALGLLDGEPEVRDLLRSGRSVEVSFLERVAAAGTLDISALLPFAGLTLEDFYSRADSGGLLYAHAASREAGAEAPLVFQSALAGVLLAAEIVIDAALQRPPIPATTRIDLRQPLKQRLLVPAPRDPYGRCLCGDADYRAVYARKYSA